MNDCQSTAIIQLLWPANRNKSRSRAHRVVQTRPRRACTQVWPNSLPARQTTCLIGAPELSDWPVRAQQARICAVTSSPVNLSSAYSSGHSCSKAIMCRPYIERKAPFKVASSGWMLFGPDSSGPTNKELNAASVYKSARRLVSPNNPAHLRSNQLAWRARFACADRPRTP